MKRTDLHGLVGGVLKRRGQAGYVRQVDVVEGAVDERGFDVRVLGRRGAGDGPALRQPPLGQQPVEAAHEILGVLALGVLQRGQVAAVDDPLVVDKVAGHAQVAQVDLAALPDVQRQRAVLESVEAGQDALLLLLVQRRQQLRPELLRLLELEVGVEQFDQTLEAGPLHRVDGQAVRHQRPRDVVGQLLLARAVPVPLARLAAAAARPRLGALSAAATAAAAARRRHGRR